jgi:hypothetical protein
MIGVLRVKAWIQFNLSATYLKVYKLKTSKLAIPSKSPSVMEQPHLLYLMHPYTNSLNLSLFRVTK